MTNDVALGCSSVDAECAAETGLKRLIAGKGHQNAVLAAIFIIAVGGFSQEHAIQHFKAAHIAGTHAEDHKVLALLAGVDDLDLLPLGLEIHEVFGLREEKVLRAAHGVERVGQHLAVLPFLKPRARLAVDRQIQGVLCGNGGKEGVQTVKCQFTHCPHPSPLPHPARCPRWYNSRSGRGCRPLLPPDIPRRTRRCP